MGTRFQKFREKVQTKLADKFKASDIKLKACNTRLKTSLTKSVKDVSNKLKSLEKTVKQNVQQMNSGFNSVEKIVHENVDRINSGFEDLHSRRDVLTGRLLQVEEKVKDVSKNHKKLKKLLDSCLKEVREVNRKVVDLVAKKNKKRKCPKEPKKKKGRKRSKKTTKVEGVMSTPPFLITLPPTQQMPSLPPRLPGMEVQPTRGPHYVSPVYSARNYAR